MESKLPYTKVMVIDDSKMDNLLINMILKSINYSLEVISFQNPAEALQYFKKIETENDDLSHPEVIFLDINMPILSGFDFLEQYNKLKHPKTKKCKIFMLSSSDETEDIEKASSYPNVIKYLKKPLDRGQLLD
jgi:CheY-like chemotaxis protein